MKRPPVDFVRDTKKSPSIKTSSSTRSSGFYTFATIVRRYRSERKMSVWHKKTREKKVVCVNIRTFILYVRTRRDRIEPKMSRKNKILLINTIIYKIIESWKNKRSKSQHTQQQRKLPFFLLLFLFLFFLPWRRQDTGRDFGKTLTRSISVCVCVGLWVRVL